MKLARKAGEKKTSAQRFDMCAVENVIDFSTVISIIENIPALPGGKRKYVMDKKYTIAVAGTGYVGLSVATLLSQHHKVYAVDIVPAKVDMVNSHKSPIQDEYIEKYLAEKDLDLTATLDAEMAYSAADFVVIAAPTNVYSTNRIDVT